MAAPVQAPQQSAGAGSKSSLNSPFFLPLQVLVPSRELASKHYAEHVSWAQARACMPGLLEQAAA